MKKKPETAPLTEEVLPEEDLAVAEELPLPEAENPCPEAEPVPEETPAEPVETVPAAEPEESEIPRLAEEFLLLTEEFPALRTPDDLPEEVLETAIEQKIPLLDAYLRFRWQEEKKTRAELQRRQQAAHPSAGSLSQGKTDSRPERDVFLRAFRHALGN